MSPFDAAFAQTIATQIEATSGVERLRALRHEFAAADLETVLAILEEAAKFAAHYLAPLNRKMDKEGCRIDEGRVRLIDDHSKAWAAFVEGGWTTLDQPAEYGGQNLPLFLWAATQEIFDQGCVAFGMLPGLQRGAARLIAAWADDEIKAEWLPRLIAGEWGATICISEPDAGSDAGRTRSLARPNGDGSWSITGEKIWISFGDHDLTPRIGHCLLARTPDAPPGGAGLSLFLVPNTIKNSNGSLERNAVYVRRIEEKMGLHGSPTCALGFEGARGHLIGTLNKGLPQMFVMITNMRISVGIQGQGLAAGAASAAMAYAEERRQGGPIGKPPIVIAEHADVKRMLLEMTARAEVMRGLLLATSVQVDLADYESDPASRDTARALTQWLLPIVKTTGGEFGFDVANQAIQVFGGAGYTKEWPVEQTLRDARVLTIFEGTTGIQSLDLLHRRLWKDNARGLKAFLHIARPDAELCDAQSRAHQNRCLALLEDASSKLMSMSNSPHDAEAGATAFLHLAALAATGWIATRLAALEPEGSIQLKLIAAGRFWLNGIADKAAFYHAESIRGAAQLKFFDHIGILKRSARVYEKACSSQSLFALTLEFERI